MSHPLLPKPAEYTAPPVFVDISQLEPAAEFATVKASMLARAAGSKAMTMTRSFPRGSGDTSSGAAPRNADGDGVAFVSKAVRFHHTRSVRVIPPHALPLVLAAHQTLPIYNISTFISHYSSSIVRTRVRNSPLVIRRNASEVLAHYSPPHPPPPHYHPPLPPPSIQLLRSPPSPPSPRRSTLPTSRRFPHTSPRRPFTTGRPSTARSSLSALSSPTKMWAPPSSRRRRSHLLG